MKKKLHFLCATLFMATIANAQTVGDLFEDGDYGFKITSISPLEASVTGLTLAAAANTTLVIPATATNAVGAYTCAVTSVGTAADSKTTSPFHNNATIVTVTLPSSVTTLGGGLFYLASALESINLENVVFFGKNCFESATKLKTTGVLSKATILSDYAFYKTAITSLSFPVAITIGSGAIASVPGLTTLDIPASVTSIGTLFFAATSATASTHTATQVTVHWANPSTVTMVTSGTPATTNFMRYYSATELAAITLNVPTGSEALYASHPQWGQLKIPTLATNNLVKEGAVSIYPNPTKDLVNIRLEDAAATNITVFDVTGKSVLSTKVNDTQSEVNLSDLNSGVYLLNVKTDKGETTKRIVKQ